MALVEQVERYAPLHEEMVNEAVHLVSGWNRKLPAEAEGREDWYYQDLPYALLSDSVALPLAVKSMCSHFYKKVREHGTSFSWTDPANYPVACTGSGSEPCKLYPSIVPSIGDLCHECTRDAREDTAPESVETIDKDGSLHDFPARETSSKEGSVRSKVQHDESLSSIDSGSGSTKSHGSSNHENRIYNWATMCDSLGTTAQELNLGLAAEGVHLEWKRLLEAPKKDWIGYNSLLVNMIARYAPLHVGLVKEARRLISCWDQKLPPDAARGQANRYRQDIVYALLVDSLTFSSSVMDLITHYYRGVQEHGGDFAWADPAFYPSVCKGFEGTPCDDYPSIALSPGGKCRNCTNKERFLVEIPDGTQRPKASGETAAGAGATPEMSKTRADIVSPRSFPEAQTLNKQKTTSPVVDTVTSIRKEATFDLSKTRFSEGSLHDFSGAPSIDSRNAGRLMPSRALLS